VKTALLLDHRLDALALSAVSRPGLRQTSCAAECRGLAGRAGAQLAAGGLGGGNAAAVAELVFRSGTRAHAM